MSFGCFYARGLDGESPPLVYVNVGAPLFSKLHELGHAYSDQRVDASDRLYIERVARWRKWREEPFADEFADCRLNVRPPEPWEPSAYGVLRSARRIRALCAAIAAAF